MGNRTEELSTDIAGTRQTLAQDLDELQDRVSPSAVVARRKAAARDRVLGVRNRIMGSASQARESTGNAASGAAGSAKDTVRDTASSAAGVAQERYEGSPLGAGLVAFGLGMVVAGMFPASRAEASAASSALDQGRPLLDEARSVGQDVVSGVQGTATEAAQQVKDSAQESVSRVQDEGRSAVGDVQSSATSE
ncbi:DUF3618 domain-containing protein [Nocardioides sp. dk4132]|uniref:DUF3618 domain-containing protein n=1 Tax=unclassified Nocardioides TaxID=2615069 RepID=UPI00129603D1|nr:MULTISPECIES: DUF3618 domain-containing protein [unclassified Nocardioides]MQW75818.1 DUF3618 domain-containing protein [Nocardioides sp. dk4132]QGA08692.1 DUF3618 domain-containing protein [Nocardioides sp. dk884]